MQDAWSPSRISYFYNSGCSQGEESVPPGPKASAAALDAILNDPNSPEWLWIVDPIDGTTNFVQGMPLSAISIGTIRNRPTAEGWC
eukprot:8781424-Pyramimonas_sp.AAC.2